VGTKQRRLGNYTLLELVGMGGMAEVWKAEIRGPERFRRTVAIKHIRPELAAEARFVDLFMREARLSAYLHHGNIVQVYELGQEGDDYFLAMEYIDGTDLARVLRALEKLPGATPPPGLAACVVRDVCRGLQYAHDLRDERGGPLALLHRDVSPTNVMLTRDGVVKLVDFGIAKAMAETDARTATALLKGKLGYMAPEQIDGGAASRQTDLFSAGVLLHEILTGHRLFLGGSDMENLQLMRHGQVVPPSSRNSAIPPALDQICMRALARDPAERYASAGEMAADLAAVTDELHFTHESIATLLREVLSAATVTAAPTPTAAQPAPSPPKRGRSAAMAVGALAAGAIAAVVLARWGTFARTPRRSPAATAARTVGVRRQPAEVATAEVAVTSVPFGAAVFVDDEESPRGHTPCTLSVGEGTVSHQLRFEADRYRPATIAFVSGRDARVHVDLTPAPAVRVDRRTKKPVGLSRGRMVDPFAL
jgi:serine/threonine-protein kinase